jgi:ribosome-binding factor A
MALHSRIKRINEELRSALAFIIMGEVKDPRVIQGMVTVTQVAVSKDLHSAQVWVSVLGNDEEAAAAVAGLNHSRGFIRHLLSERVVLKYMPDLHFRLDVSGRHAAHINELLKKIEREQAPEQKVADEESEPEQFEEQE